MPDRKIQRQIFETLRTAYPKRVDTRSMTFSDTVGENLAYLEEHGLVDAKWAGNFAVANAKITARGIDFLSDDGGLSTILDTVTVKLHSDTIKELLAWNLIRRARPMAATFAAETTSSAASTRASTPT